MPTFSFGSHIEWTPDKGTMKTISADLAAADCKTYKCLLDASSKGCH
jgi:hypothetical protein